MRSARSTVAFAAASVALALPTLVGAATPDLSDQQWDMIDIGAPEANTVATGAGVTVAVIDTGIDVDHPEFAGRIVQPASWVCAEGVEVPCTGLRDVDDGHGHGTHVAGTVAAADDGQGITGVAPDADIMPLRVGDDSGAIVGDLTEAMRYGIDHGADVITMSIGGLLGTGAILDFPLISSFSQAVADAQAAGILVTLAAGNDSLPFCGQGELWQNAALCVGAYGPSGADASYTNWGLGIDILAPGGGTSCETGVLSTFPLEHTGCDGIAGYDSIAGTSMATPHVAGVGALLAEQGVTGSAAFDRIVNTARPGQLPLPLVLLGGLTGPRLDAAAAVGA